MTLQRFSYSHVASDVVASGATTEPGLNAIRNQSLTNKDLQQLALLLSDEKTQHQIEGAEERLGETIRSAIQSYAEQIHRDGDLTSDRRRGWFDNHILPAHQLMEEIAKDYHEGFSETVAALRSGRGLEETMQRLMVIQRRKRMGRADLEIVVKKLDSNRELFGTSLDAPLINLDAPLINYVEAIQAFRRSDASLYGKSATWYSYYMEEFVRLIEWGEDPRERSNYSGISAVQDLQGQLAFALEGVVDSVMPARWKAYKAAYLDLEKAVEATG